MTKGAPQAQSKPRDEWPEEWTKLYRHSYDRFPKTDLPEGRVHCDLSECLKRRTSERSFSRNAMDAEALGALLRMSAGAAVGEDTGTYRRPYPSAGARFPLEIYVLLPRPCGDCPAGIHHYNVTEHHLSHLECREFSNTELGELFADRWVMNASAIVLLTAVFWRTQNKYGDRGYRYVLLEAGHLAQNVALAAAALNVKCCATGNTDDVAIERLFDIDGETQSLIHTIALGD